jgi:putative ABC transport system substrate-binding protein
MKRRAFITLIGGAMATWPLAAGEQQPKVPVIGYLSAGSAAASAPNVSVFRQSLAEAGYVVGRNAAIEYGFAEGQYDSVAGDGGRVSPQRGRPDRSARHVIPAAFNAREFVEVGGLMSYGTSLTEVFRQLGAYAGRILKGAKPVDLPVVRSVTFEFVHQFVDRQGARPRNSLDRARPRR